MAFHPFNYLTEQQILQILETAEGEIEFPGLFQRSNSGRELNLIRTGDVARQAYATGGHEALSRLTDHVIHRSYSGNQGIEARRMLSALLTHYATENLNIQADQHHGHGRLDVDVSKLEHPDLPHHTNATRDADLYRDQLVAQLANGTYQPPRQHERVIDLSYHGKGVSDHPEASEVKVINLGAMSRSAKAFDLDRAAREATPNLIAPESRSDEVITSALGLQPQEAGQLHGTRLGETQELSRRHEAEIQGRVAQAKTQRELQSLAQGQQLIAQQQELLGRSQEKVTQQQELLGQRQQETSQQTKNQLHRILAATTSSMSPEEQVSSAPLLKASSINTLQTLSSPASSRIPRRKNVPMRESMELYVNYIRKGKK